MRVSQPPPVPEGWTSHTLNVRLITATTSYERCPIVAVIAAWGVTPPSRISARRA